MSKHNIHTLARLAGVSAATVSRVLNGNPQVKAHLKEKVLQALQETGFQPDPKAQSLRAGKTRTVSIILPMVDTDFYRRLLWAMESVFEPAGYDLGLYPLVGSLKTRRYQQATALPYQGDGLILSSLNLSTLYNGLPIPFQKPTVLVDTQHEGHASFCIDNFWGGVQAARHLCSFPEPMVLIGLRQDLTSPFVSPVLQARYNGIQHGLKLHGRTLAGAEYVDLTTEGGRQAARGWFQHHPEPCQFLCMADTVALGVLRHVREQGLEARVLGFDDHTFAAKEGLTSIAQPIEEMGKQAAQHLLNLLEGHPTEPIQVVLPPELVVRESSLHLSERRTL